MSTTTPAIISSLAPITLKKVGGNHEVLAVESVGFSADVIAAAHHHSGNMAPTLIRIPGANPRVVVSMPFKSAYDYLGLGVTKLDGLVLYNARFADFVRAGAGAHTSFSLVSGCQAAAHIVGWSVNVDGILMAQVEIVPLAASSGIHPLAFNTGVTLPAITGSPTLHTLGPCTINGTVIPGLSASAGQVNGPLQALRNDGDLYPRAAARIQVEPTLNLSHRDPATVLASLGLIGVVLTEASAYFKRYDPATGVTDYNSDAIRVTLASGIARPDGQNAAQGQVNQCGIIIQPVGSDGTAMPLTITTNAVPPDAP